MKLFYAGVSAAVIFAGACSADKTSTPSSESTVETTVEAAIENSVDVKTSADLCTDFGPQTPRDISSLTGLNLADFQMAPAASELNLCNIHTHTNAEHKGPGFNVFVNNTDNGGYACNDSDSLSAEQLTDPFTGEGGFKGAKPGDTIEVHWVHTSCDITPGEGLGSCLTETCQDPLLRVEAQVFLVVNDPDNAYDFADVAYGGTLRNDKHQAASIPSDTGTPVVFRGSTTGPSYTQSKCSPLKVTWSVRPECARVDIGSLHRWAQSGNVFNETKSHGVRQLVTAPELLSPIQ